MCIVIASTAITLPNYFILNLDNEIINTTRANNIYNISYLISYSIMTIPKWEKIYRNCKYPK